jgi:hypothetical protein
VRDDDDGDAATAVEAAPKEKTGCTSPMLELRGEESAEDEKEKYDDDDDDITGG